VRVLIADDEAPLRAWLKRLLAELSPQAEVVGEAANGTEALASIRSLRPDVAFLDIRMPGLSGLEVAARAEGACRIVFVTAHDEFALAAFEQAAVDYLVKPVSPERLGNTLRRLGQPHAAADSAALLQALLKRLEQGTAQPGRLRWLRVGDDESVRLIDIVQVDFLKAADKYTEVHQADQAWLVRTALSELEKDLDPDRFWRIHRSLIVRVEAIREARRDVMGRIRVHLHSGGSALPVSRAHAHLFSRN
jgi:DNA-binding LytR/AlgR family response regulator